MSQPLAYPLSWPPGWPRAKIRERARFGRREKRSKTYQRSDGSTYQATYFDSRSLSVMDAIRRLRDELDRLGAAHPILSSNIELRLDGWPRSDRHEPSDPGVALYFDFRKQKTVLACDKWDRVADNIAALAGHIYSLRAIERYGVGTLEQAFRGYQQLEDFSAGMPWRRVLGFKDDEQPTREQIESKYRELAKQYHPDIAGGNHKQMAELTAAISAARKEFDVR